MRKLGTSQSGYTFMETFIAMTLTLVVMAGVWSVYRSQAHTIGVQENRRDAQDYARSVLDMMVREIRNAGANPLLASTGTNCAGTPTAGTPGVITATSTRIKFTYDYRGSASGSAPDGNCNNTDEEITYEYLTPGPQNCASGLGDIVRTANGTSETITNCNVTAFSFAYYAKDVATAMSPIVVASIQRVKATLTIQSKNPDAAFGGQLTGTVYSNINLTNRGL